MAYFVDVVDGEFTHIDHREDAILLLEDAKVEAVLALSQLVHCKMLDLEVIRITTTVRDEAGSSVFRVEVTSTSLPKETTPCSGGGRPEGSPWVGDGISDEPGDGLQPTSQSDEAGRVRGLAATSRTGGASAPHEPGTA